MKKTNANSREIDGIWGGHDTDDVNICFFFKGHLGALPGPFNIFLVLLKHFLLSIKRPRFT